MSHEWYEEIFVITFFRTCPCLIFYFVHSFQYDYIHSPSFYIILFYSPSFASPPQTTQQPSSIYSQNSLLLASVHASLGLDCSIDNITHLLNYEEDDDDDNGSNDVTPHNSPLMGEERMKKMKMDLMSEMMGACDDYVQSLESLQQQLQDVTKERDHLKSLVQSRVSMVDRSTSPISTDLSITAANEITTELENELLSLLDQSLTTYQLTCQVAGEKVNCRAIEHVTGRRKDVVERRKKKRSEEQLCVDLFKMAASSCDLVRSVIWIMSYIMIT